MSRPSINTPFINLDTELAALHAGNEGNGESGSNGWPSAVAAYPPRGAVCLMPFPFTDGSGVRVRPTLVLAHHGPDIVVAPVTTHGPRDEFDVALRQSRRAGLRKHGAVRCSHAASLSRTLVIRVLGYIMPDDFGRVLQGITLWFQKKLLEP